MAASTWKRSRMYGGRKRSTVSLVQLMTMRRFSISATVELGQVGRVELGGEHEAFATHVNDGFVVSGKLAQLTWK